MSPAPRLYTPSGESVNQQTLKKNIKKKGGGGGGDHSSLSVRAKLT